MDVPKSKYKRPKDILKTKTGRLGGDEGRTRTKKVRPWALDWPTKFSDGSRSNDRHQKLDEIEKPWH